MNKVCCEHPGAMTIVTLATPAPRPPAGACRTSLDCVRRVLRPVGAIRGRALLT